MNSGLKVPHRHYRGRSRYHGGLLWDKIKDGYTYDMISNPWLPDELGMSLVIFERGTNQPYIAYIENPVDHYNRGDTIILNKSDFEACEFKTIQVKNTGGGAYLQIITYNSKEGGHDLITCYVREDYGSTISYVSSDILPISHWEFYKGFSRTQSTSYRIRTNMDVPSSIEIKELRGSKFERYGNQYNLTHGEVYNDKNLSMSTLSISKTIRDRASIYYKMHFNGIESIGRVPIEPIEIPEEILINNITLRELDDIKWESDNYNQFYTNLQDNSPLEYLENTFLRLNKENSLADEYIHEEFGVFL